MSDLLLSLLITAVALVAAPYVVSLALNLLGLIFTVSDFLARLFRDRR